MSDYLFTRLAEVGDAEISNLEFPELSAVARKILASANLPYAEELLNGTPEQVRQIKLELAKRIVGARVAEHQQTTAVH